MISEINKMLGGILNKEQEASLKKLSATAENHLEKLGKKIIEKAEESGMKAEEWLRNDGKKYAKKISQKVDEIIVRDNSGEVNLKEETEKILKKLTGEPPEKTLDEDIDELNSAIDELDNYSSETSHLEALQTEDALDDVFMDTAEKFLKGNLSPRIKKKDVDESGSEADSNARTHGFKDRDGDGNDLIDDAEIETE